MKRLVRWSMVMALLAAAGGNEAYAQSCDRACLKTVLDQYLAAVVKHDPAAAPLVIGYRHTENALNKKLGDGVWKSVTGLGKMQRKYFDAVTGQAAYYGLIDEGTSPALVTARIRVQDRKVTEGEWYIARPDDPGLQGPRQPGRGPANLFNPEYLTANPPPERVVARDKRVDRGALERIVDSYFDAITSHDGSVALTHPGCCGGPGVPALPPPAPGAPGPPARAAGGRNRPAGAGEPFSTRPQPGCVSATDPSCDVMASK